MSLQTWPWEGTENVIHDPEMANYQLSRVDKMSAAGIDVEAEAFRRSPLDPQRLAAYQLSIIYLHTNIHKIAIRSILTKSFLTLSPPRLGNWAGGAAETVLLFSRIASETLVLSIRNLADLHWYPFDGS